MTMPDSQMQSLSDQLLAFARARDWEQFHSPKNLSMALAGEAGELLAHFQWLTEARSRSLDAEKTHAVSLEMADIYIYLLRLAQVLGVDLDAAAREKMLINDRRYPADRVRGDARRADEWDQED